MITEDKTAFFNDFKETIYYTPPNSAHISNDTRTVDALVDVYTYEAMEGVQTTRTLFLVLEDDVSDVAEGARVKYGADNYTVREYPKNGEGFMVLIVEKDDL